MISVTKVYNLNVNFLKGIFASDEKIIFIENDNKSSKFIFKFEDETDLSGKYATLKIKHYLGFVKEITLLIKNNASEFILTNDILLAGKAKMSISLIGDDNEILTAVDYLDNIEIKESLGNGEINSENELAVLEKILSNMENFVKKEDVPTRTSELENDSGFMTEFEEQDPTIPSCVKDLTEEDILKWNNKSDFSGDYEDLENKPCIEGLASVEYVDGLVGNIDVLLSNIADESEVI